MEAIITVVGFLGAGKTTLLKRLMTSYIENDWNPFIILNDYENAHLDAQEFLGKMDSKSVRALNGSCICCSGINELRDFVNNIPERKNGITLIEANGTSDACSLISFLGVGIVDRFLPPIQISVVDVVNWQQRGEHNELEANQVQVSSLIVLTHAKEASNTRKKLIINDLKKLNPLAKIIDFENIDIALLPKLSPNENEFKKLDHLKAHWSSCSTDLPKLPNIDSIHNICNSLPSEILRIKGCTQIGDDEAYTYFERTPDNTIRVRPFRGIPITGSKLLTIGPGSTIELLKKAIATGVLLKN